MSKKTTEFQRKAMSRMYRGKEIFKPLNTGWIDKSVACVREWVANIFFYCKDNAVIMIDAGYNYDRLAEKMGWLGIAPQSVQHILITHQDTDHVGAVEADSPGLFQNAALYIGEVENRYLTGEVRRKVIYHLYKLPQVTINNKKVLLQDGEVINIDGIKIECFLVPGHTWGHMVYLVDDRYLFTGDTIWFGADGGYSFISALAEDNELAVRSLTALEEKLRRRDLHPLFITGHTGWTDNMDFAFAHRNELCSPFRRKAHDPNAPYDAYDESDDTEERVYGDNVFEKDGIRRDRTGDREKTRYLCGKQGIFTRDRALIRPGFIRQLETRASTRSASFFHALGSPGRPHNGGGAAGAYRTRNGAKPLKQGHLRAKRGPLGPSRKSQQQTKRTGFAAHGHSIAETAPEGKRAKRAKRANGALIRA